MSFINMRAKFTEKYTGDIQDPILKILLDTIEMYQNDVQEKLLLSTYSSWAEGPTEGLFEVLRRNLFGQMFPGPIFSVAHGRLADVKSANPLLIESNSHFSMQDTEGNKNLFSPQSNAWVIPSFSNDVHVKIEDDDLLLGFNLVLENIPYDNSGYASIYFDVNDVLILERIKCRIAIKTKEFNKYKEDVSIFKRTYPATHDTTQHFFKTPYESRFLKIPFSYFHDYAIDKNFEEGNVWLRFEGLANYFKKIDKKLTLNSFLIWNLVKKEALIDTKRAGIRFPIPNAELNKKNINVTRVFDHGFDPPIEYYDSSFVLDPEFPNQFTTVPNQLRDALLISTTPKPKGDLKVEYYEYDLNELCNNLPAGKPLILYKGLDDHLQSLQSLLPTSRNEALNDKNSIWNYFRSQIASRNRLITEDDLRAAIMHYPPFVNKPDLLDYSKIEFIERVGRVRGFITTYTDIEISVRDSDILQNPDKQYFEKDIGLYLKSRTVNGNFLKVTLVKEEMIEE